MNSLCSLGRNAIRYGVAAALLLSLCPAIAFAASVRGHGEVNNGTLSPSQISVDAWLDASGGVHGSMVWVGDVAPGILPMGGPADPWFINVTRIVFDGNTAYVSGVVAHSVFPTDIGTTVNFVFTDNRRTTSPDQINYESISAGNITVID